MTETTANQALDRFWKETDRPLAEQLVGFVIIALACLGVAFGGSLLISVPFPLIYALIHLSTALAFWMLWRRHSLRRLHWEISLFSATFLFEGIWFIASKELLLGLVVLLLWMSSALCCAALFWKKDKWAAQFFIPLMLWILTLVSVNMVLCIVNF